MKPFSCRADQSGSAAELSGRLSRPLRLPGACRLHWQEAALMGILILVHLLCALDLLVDRPENYADRDEEEYVEDRS